MDGQTTIDHPEQNTDAIAALYRALAIGEKKIVGDLIASDLEWWFHRPQNCHHMMRMLTGESSPSVFRFEPRSIKAFDDRVIVEGWEGAKVYRVHVWTIKNDVVTQFREYFNTWLTVKELRPKASTLWKSQPTDLFKRSLPGIMLAI